MSFKFNIGDRVEAACDMHFPEGDVLEGSPGIVLTATYDSTWSQDSYSVEFDGYGYRDGIFERGLRSLAAVAAFKVGDQVRANCDGIINEQWINIPNGTCGTIVYLTGKCYDVDFDGYGLAQHICGTALDMISKNKTKNQPKPRNVEEFIRQQMDDNLSSIFG